MTMPSRKLLARQAMRAGIELRRKLKIPLMVPLCAVDCANRLGVDVIYAGGSSFSGMYDNLSKTILVPALRPIGYQAFTCAHELGHWHFKHGTRVDELGEFENVTNDNPEEQLANLFAGSFLMPRRAVLKAFNDRGWKTSNCDDLQVYNVANYFGVGYGTLIQHMRWSLNEISSFQVGTLEKSSPKMIRQKVLRDTESKHMVVTDLAWRDIAIDLRVGDTVVLPPGTSNNSVSLKTVEDSKTRVVAIAVFPSVTRVATNDGDWAAYVRISRQDYRGQSENRHKEDPDFVNPTECGYGREFVNRMGQIVSSGHGTKA